MLILPVISELVLGNLVLIQPVISELHRAFNRTDYNYYNNVTSILELHRSGRATRLTGLAL